MRINEPTGLQYLQLGDPRMPVSLGEGGGYWIEQPKVIQDYLDRVLDHGDGRSKDQGGVASRLLSFTDARAIKAALFDFFRRCGDAYRVAAGDLVFKLRAMAIDAAAENQCPNCSCFTASPPRSCRGRTAKMAVLESKLIIGASDETGAAFASVMARITELSAKIAAVNVGGFTPAPALPDPACNDGGDRRALVAGLFAGRHRFRR